MHRFASEVNKNWYMLVKDLCTQHSVLSSYSRIRLASLVSFLMFA